jgi:pimeloyl-ACP methyl ester carboxylesterase
VADLFVRESGSRGAPAVLFLHAVGSTGAMWERHLAELTDFHCLAPDLPGHGQSRSSGWSSRQDTAERVVGLLEARLDGGRANVVGLSLGGSVAYEVLSRRPDLFDHAVIDGCGAVASRLEALMTVAVALVSPFVGRRAVGRLVARGLGLSEAAEIESFVDQLGQADPASFRRAFSDAQGVRITDGLLRARARTLLVAGEKELASVRGSNRLLGESMQVAESWMVPGAGHGWLARDPLLHVAMVRAWLSDEPLPPRMQSEMTPRAGSGRTTVHVQE